MEKKTIGLVASILLGVLLFSAVAQAGGALRRSLVGAAYTQKMAELAQAGASPIPEKVLAYNEAYGYGGKEPQKIYSGISAAAASTEAVPQIGQVRETYYSQLGYNPMMKLYPALAAAGANAQRQPMQSRYRAAMKTFEYRQQVEQNILNAANRQIETGPSLQVVQSAEPAPIATA